MRRKIVAISLALVMILPFAACGGEELPSSQEVIDSTMEAMEDLRTCRFDMDMAMDMTGEVEGEEMEMAMDIDLNGAMDIENTQMEMDMTMNIAMSEDMPGVEDIDMDMEMYLVDNTFYMMIDSPLMGPEPMWMKFEMPEEIPGEYWDPTALMELQTEFLEALEFEVTGSEIVSGVDCYVLEVTADIGQLWELIVQQVEETGLDMDDIPEDFEELLDEMFRNFSLKQWIAKDTYLPAKVEIELDIEFTPEILDVLDADGEITIDASLTMLMYDYNQPVSIELPPEAEEAVDISDIPMGF